MNQKELLEEARKSLQTADKSSDPEWGQVYVHMAFAYIALADRAGGYGLPSLSDVFEQTEASKPKHSAAVEVEEKDPVQVQDIDATQSIPTVSQ